MTELVAVSLLLIAPPALAAFAFGWWWRGRYERERLKRLISNPAVVSWRGDKFRLVKGGKS